MVSLSNHEALEHPDFGMASYNKEIVENYDSFYKPTQEGRILTEVLKNNIEGNILDMNQLQNSALRYRPDVVSPLNN